MPQSLDPARCQHALDEDVVLLLDAGIAAGQTPRHAALLSEHQHAASARVERASRRQPAQVGKDETLRRVVFDPAIVATDAANRGLAPRRRRCIAGRSRLVEQDTDARAAVLARRIPDLDRRFRADAGAKAADHHAIDADPAVLDPFVGLAA